MRQHQVEPAAQDRGALLGGLLAPLRKRAVGRLDRVARFGGAELRHGADDLAGRRIVDVDRRAAAGIHPRAVDVAGLAEEFRIGELDAGDESLMCHGSTR